MVLHSCLARLQWTFVWFSAILRGLDFVLCTVKMILQAEELTHQRLWPSISTFHLGYSPILWALGVQQNHAAKKLTSILLGLQFALPSTWQHIRQHGPTEKSTVSRSSLACASFSCCQCLSLVWRHFSAAVRPFSNSPAASGELRIN